MATFSSTFFHIVKISHHSLSVAIWLQVTLKDHCLLTLESTPVKFKSQGNGLLDYPGFIKVVTRRLTAEHQLHHP